MKRVISGTILLQSEILGVGVMMMYPFLIRQIYKISREDTQKQGREGAHFKLVVMWELVGASK